MSKIEKMLFVTSVVSSLLMAIICYFYYQKKMQTEFERGYLFGVEAHKNRMSLPGIDSIIIKGSDIQPWRSK